MRFLHEFMILQDQSIIHAKIQRTISAVYHVLRTVLILRPSCCSSAALET
jgi:hypothetical protein